MEKRKPESNHRTDDNEKTTASLSLSLSPAHALSLSVSLCLSLSAKRLRIDHEGIDVAASASFLLALGIKEHPGIIFTSQ